MDKVSATKAEFRFKQWSKIIQDCQSSSLSITEWCNQNNIGAKTYYYWLRKIRKKSCETMELPVPVIKQPIVPLQLSLRESNKSSGSLVTIRLGSASIEIAEGASQAMIETVLKSLQNVC